MRRARSATHDVTVMGQQRRRRRPRGVHNLVGQAGVGAELDQQPRSLPVAALGRAVQRPVAILPPRRRAIHRVSPGASASTIMIAIEAMTSSGVAKRQSATLTV